MSNITKYNEENVRSTVVSKVIDFGVYTCNFNFNYRNRPISLVIPVDFKLLFSFAMLMFSFYYYNNNTVQSEVLNTDVEAVVNEVKIQEVVNTNVITISTEPEDRVNYTLELLDKEAVTVQNSIDKEAIKQQFLVEKTRIASSYIIRHAVKTSTELPDSVKLIMNKDIRAAFIEIVLNQIKAQPHVYKFFVEDKDLDKIGTALMEQIKSGIPASIKLAQACVETAYGKSVVGNNYFGIKSKEGQPFTNTTTIEYLNDAEMKAISSKVIKHQVVTRNGQVLNKCFIRDNFHSYESPWTSFREHSKFLLSNKRYHYLFTKGKDYKAWADALGSTKDGGVGYATSPIYGEVLKKVIERYNLDLLDY